MRRKLILILSAVWLSVPAHPAYAADPATKLGRGVMNTAFGWFEIINEIGNESDQHGPLIGLPSGLLRGTALGVIRTVAGVYEIVTFLIPNGSKGYEPVVHPETVFTRR